MTTSRLSFPSRTLLVRTANIVAPPLVLLAPFPTYLQFNDYDIGRPEIFLSFGLLVGLGLAISGLIALRPGTLRPAMIGLLWAFFLDVHLRAAIGGTNDWVLEWRWLAERGPTAFAVASTLVIVCMLLLTWLMRRHIGEITSTVFGVILLSGFILPAEVTPLGERFSRVAEPRSDLPPIVHIVLDGQIGPNGLPGDIPGSMKLRDELNAFYETYGFTLFHGAFSSYSMTYESLSNMFNGGIARRSGANLAAIDGEIPVRALRLRENTWFRRLSDRGYRLRLYYTEYLDFCSPNAANIDYCYVAPFQSIYALVGADLAPDLKARIILESFLSGSGIYRMIARAIRKFTTRNTGESVLPSWPWEHPTTGVLTAVTIPDRLAEDLAAAPRGTALFAHLLLPHGAFIHDAACRPMTDLNKWVGEHNLDAPKPYNQTLASRVQRYLQYFDQVRCTHRQLAKLFDRMKELDVFEDATIIVHGDHGSRISRLIPWRAVADLLTSTDLIDSFSTLFAVRKPGWSRKGDQRQRSIQNLFGEIFLGREPSSASEGVFLQVQTRKVGHPFVEKPMPNILN